MILQAVVDDSGSRTIGNRARLYLLGGLIATVDEWKALAEEWDAALREVPALEYFKMSEALSLKGQFSRDAGWTEEMRDRRVLALSDIVVKHVEMPLFVWLDHGDYNNLVKAFTPFDHLRDPYFLLFQHMTELVSRQMPRFPSMRSLQYFFDEKQHIGKHSRDFWERLKAATDGGGSDIKIIGSTPNLVDDRQFLPMQAADLYAEATRNDLDGNRTHLLVELARRFSATKMQPVGAHYDRESLLRLGALLVVKGAGA